MSDDGSARAPDATGSATVWRRSGDAAHVESPDRAVVLDLDHLDLPPYVFEGTAAQIWSRVDGEHTESDIVLELATAYGAPVDEVATDVREFIDRLRVLGLVVVGDR